MSQGESSQLQREIQQTVPFRSSAQEAVIAIARTADVVTARFDRALAPYGITPQQYNVLRILRGARGKPLRTQEVGERMVQRTPGVTRLIDRLEAKGLARRQPCRDDRRVVYCVITEAALDLLSRTDAMINALEDQIGSALSPAHLTVLIEGLDRIRTAADR